MPAPRIDGTITFGNLISLIGFLVAALLAWGAMSAEMSVARAEIHNVKVTVERLTGMLERDAVRETEIRELKRRLDILEASKRSED